jgi:hypothetical protein
MKHRLGRWEKLVAGIAIFSAPPLCLAVGAQAAPLFPYHYHKEQNIDAHQIGYVDVVLNPDGTGWVTATFSNGKQWAGNKFAAETSLVSADGTKLDCIRQTKRLDGSWGGQARESSVTTEIRLTPEQLRRFDHVEVAQMIALYDGLILP